MPTKMKFFKHPLTYIFIFSLFLHWQNIGNSTMVGPDFPRDYERAVQISNGEYFPIYGFEISYLNIENPRVPGGFAYFFMSIAHLFSDHPYASIYFLGLLASLTIIIVYSLARNLGLSVRTAALASLLMATNLNVNIFSRIIDANGYILIIGALFFWVLSQVIVREKRRHQIFLLPLLGLALQINLSQFSLVFTLLCLFLIFRKHFSFPYQSIGLLIFIILYTPYLLHQIHHNFADIKEILSNIGPGLFYEQPQKTLKAIRWPLEFSIPYPSYHIVSAENQFYNGHILRTAPLCLSIVFGLILFICPFFKFIKNGIKSSIKSDIPLAFLILSISSVIIFNLLRFANCEQWYFYTILPLIAVCQAFGFSYLHDQCNTKSKRLILNMLLCIFIFCSIAEFHYYQNFNENHMHGTIKNHLDAIEYMQKESGNNYQITSEMDVEYLHAPYMIAKYYFKILPRHPENVLHFPYNDINLPSPDKNTVVFYFHQSFPDQKLPERIPKQSLSRKQFGTLHVYRLN